jgi:hypothetical protein
MFNIKDNKGHNPMPKFNSNMLTFTFFLNNLICHKNEKRNISFHIIDYVFFICMNIMNEKKKGMNIFDHQKRYI